jgi:leucyl aminopeptidase
MKLPMTLSNEPLHTHSVNCYIAFISKDDFTPLEKWLHPTWLSTVQAVAKERHFVGNKGQMLAVSLVHDNQVKSVIIGGLGEKKEGRPLDMEVYRRALGQAKRTLEGLRASTCALQIPQTPLFGVSEGELLEQTVIIAEMAAYSFDEFINDKERHPTEIKDCIIVVPSTPSTLLEQFERAKVIAKAVNMARRWIDLPAGHLHPAELAQRACEVAQNVGLSCTIFDENEINQMGMGGLSAVSRGSDRDAQFVILEYKCGVANAPRIGFIGKGITFDSGGLSIKPASYMETMKEDMSGAAAVIAVMQAIGILKPTIDVVGITPLCENLPSGKATKPGDIIRFYNGKTAEVKNTDAEGRLILADALSYAVKHCNLDAMIDIATLTGACSYALGPFFSGLMSQHEELVEVIRSAAHRTGDRVWPLPLDEDYKKAIRSPVADLCNAGSNKYRAGAITAGWFLKNFVDDVPWAHLDIAGTAFDVPDISYYRPDTATGATVRLLIDIALNWKPLERSQ